MALPGQACKSNTLIVEDNDPFRETLRESLEKLFPWMGVHEAGEANEALQKVVTFRLELIIMDIQLPGEENGLQLTQKIEMSYPDTKVMILTNYDTQEYREAAERCGVSCFVAKTSLNQGNLETLVKSLLSG